MSVTFIPICKSNGALRASPLERGKGSVTPLQSKVQVMLLAQHPSISPQGEKRAG